MPTAAATSSPARSRAAVVLLIQGPWAAAGDHPAGYWRRAEPLVPTSGVHRMPIATPEVYADMITRAKEGGFAYPAINCTSSETVNAALRGFADAGSDGIIQFSTGGAEFGSGTRGEDKDHGQQ